MTTTAPETLTMELHPHQLEALRWLIDHPKALLADDVGLGKTIEVIALLEHLRLGGKFRGPCPVLWITDASVVESTREKVLEFAPMLTVLTQNDLAMKKTRKGRDLYDAEWAPLGPDITILSYSQANAWRESLPKFFPELECVVLDEVTSVKGGGVTHQSIGDLTARAPRVIGMTATPYETHPLETYNILKVIGTPNLWRTGDFNERIVEWRPGYFLPGTSKWVKEKPIGIKPTGLDEFRMYLHQVMLRRTADDVGLPLPVQVGEALRWIPLSAAQQAAYGAAERYAVGLAKHARQKRAGRINLDESTLIDAATEKVHAVGPEKVIIGCETLDVVDEVVRRLEQLGVGVRSIDGKMKQQDRAAAIADHRDDPDVRVLVASSVLERGLDLQYCRILISLDATDNPQREHQREGRVRRIGSPHDTYEHLTLMPDTPQAHKRFAGLERKRADAASLGLGR